MIALLLDDQLVMFFSICFEVVERQDLCAVKIILSFLYERHCIEPKSLKKILLLADSYQKTGKRNSQFASFYD